MVEVKPAEDDALLTAEDTRFFHAKCLLPMQVKFPRERDNRAFAGRWMRNCAFVGAAYMRPSSLRYERAMKNVEADPFRDCLTACKTTARFINALLRHGE